MGKELETRNTALRERLDYVERVLEDSAAKHEKWEASQANIGKQLQRENELRSTHYAALKDRLDSLESLAGESADKHAKWEACHPQLCKLLKEHDSHGANQ